MLGKCEMKILILMLILLAYLATIDTLIYMEQDKYKANAIELNGPDFDWLYSPVDARALYECACGCPHGKWAIFNGIINDKEVLSDLRRSRAYAMATRHQRQEEDE